MTRPEVATQNNVERHILKRAHGLQATLIDPSLVSVPENWARHEEVWGKNVDFTFPADKRVRHHKYEGKLFIKSYRKIKNINRVRWSRLEDIEAGVRQADHIIDAYDPEGGKEVGKTKQVIELVKDLSKDFQQSGLTHMDIRLIAEKGALGLLQAGFINAQRSQRLEIADKITRAAQLDSKTRVNSSRSRLILSHVWVDLIRELLVGRVTEDKYTSIQAKLIREREFERFLLGQVVAHIDGLSGKTESFEDPRRLQEIKAFAREYLSPQMVKLKPYARMAAISRFLIVNTGTAEELDALRKYIGDEADMYAGTPALTSQNLSREERIRRLGGIKTMIEEGLEIGELFLHTKSEDRKEALEQYNLHKIQSTA